MDSRWIPLLLAAGWLSVLLGIWGACGRWWVWPLGVGVGLLAVGAGYGWAMWQELKAGKREAARSPAPPTRIPERAA